ncbi:hypothetical protein Q3G72_010987 [Acer saccharum]|nr:hypothetical protein Q3G72_010987 [Acer saccharum]
MSEEEIPVVDGVEKPLFGSWMKASGPLRKNKFRDLREPTVHPLYSSGGFRIAGTSGVVGRPNAEMTEVQDRKKKGVEKIVMVDDAMAEVHKATLAAINDKSLVEVVESREQLQDIWELLVTSKAVNEGFKGIEAHIGPHMDKVLVEGPQVCLPSKPNAKIRSPLGGKVTPGGYVTKGEDIKRGKSRELGKKGWVRKIRADNCGSSSGIVDQVHGKRRGGVKFFEEDNRGSS